MDLRNPRNLWFEEASVRVLLFAVVLLAVVGCASSRGADAYDPNAVRVCIENTAVGYGNVIAYVSSVRFTVYPGEEECKNVRSAGAGLSVRAATSSGGGAGPLRFSFALPGGTYCWHWRVSNSRALDIVSCDQGAGY